jgi:DNA adenine methylase
VSCQDFEESVKYAAVGDVVYFDPPYTSAHANNGFVEYNAKVFNWDDQRRLAETAASLVDRGVQVLISNGGHESILECYNRFKCFEVVRIDRWSTMSGKAQHRKATFEILLVGAPKLRGDL